jgi:hypothetical protein
MHLIAHGAKKATGSPWLADFRDPWTNIDFYDELRLSRWADRKHHRLEAMVVRGADRVTVVSPTMEREFREDHHREIHTLTNGFDQDDISVDTVLPVDDNRFGIAHIGTMNPSRNPIGLWTALSNIIEGDRSLQSSIRLRMIGRVDHSIKTAVHHAGLQPITDYVDYVPHNEVVAWQQGASVLLLLLNQSKNAQGILPGKFFEYLASGRPILCLGPQNSDASKVLNETGSGVCLEYDDVKGIQAWIEGQMAKHPVDPSHSDNISRYTRRSLTATLAGILDHMVDQ